MNVFYLLTIILLRSSISRLSFGNNNTKNKKLKAKLRLADYQYQERSDDDLFNYLVEYVLVTF